MVGTSTAVPPDQPPLSVGMAAVCDLRALEGLLQVSGACSGPSRFLEADDALFQLSLDGVKTAPHPLPQTASVHIISDTSHLQPRCPATLFFKCYEVLHSRNLPMVMTMFNYFGSGIFGLDGLLSLLLTGAAPHHVPEPHR